MKDIIFYTFIFSSVGFFLLLLIGSYVILFVCWPLLWIIPLEINLLNLVTRFNLC